MLRSDAISPRIASAILGRNPIGDSNFRFRWYFFRGKFFVFLQGFLGKTGGRVWFFDGEFVVDGVIIVVN
jgi:hypothetical protein